LGDVLKHDAIGPEGFRGIHGVGPAEERQLKACLSRLTPYIDSNGDVAWDSYSQATGMPVPSLESGGIDQFESSKSVTPDPVIDSEASWVPTREITSGDGFIGAFPEVIEAILESRENGADRAILMERLTRQPGERKTLDQIASAQPVAITREGIRVRESKLLNQLAEALLHGKCRRLGLKFQLSFLQYWKKAAEQFGDKETISFTHFVEGLETAWGVSAEQIFVHLPLITSVLTRKAVLPEPLRAHMRRDHRVYRKLSIADAAIPVTMLPIGRAIDDLFARGIETIGDLFEAARNGFGLSYNGAIARSVERVVTALVDAIDTDGCIDWCKYEQSLGLARLPLKVPHSPGEFVESLDGVLASIISANSYTLRALEIFQMRVAVPRGRRPTLAETAAKLKTHGPCIKREESVLLSALNDQLIARDMTYSKVVISSGYLDYWAEAERAYLNCNGDFHLFRSLIASEWQLGLDELAEGGEILWAVLNRYPGGRPSRKRKRNQAKDGGQVVPAPVGVVMLRGFRKVH